jgi:hypothetical protein
MFFLVVLYGLSVGFVAVAQHQKAFIAVGDTASAEHMNLPGTVTQCTNQYPCLSPWSYPIDSVIPVINLHQTEYWQLNAAQTIGRFTRDWLYGTAILGWATTTLLIVAVTGLVRRD